LKGLPIYNKNPFFLYMAYDEVHVPLFSSPKFKNSSRRGKFGDNMREMDDSIGQIIAKIKQLGIDNNTFVFFTSDNGPWLDWGTDGGSAGLFRGGKGETWEGGIREPGIAWWPGTISPTITLEPATTMDLFSTILDLADVPLPKDRIIDGVSFKSLFKGEGNFSHNFLIFYRDTTIYAVRHKAYKAHFYTRTGLGIDPPKKHDPPLFYNIEEDPSENHPLDTKNPLYATILRKMHEAMDEHNKSLIKGPPELDFLDIDVGPCCNQITNCFC